MDIPLLGIDDFANSDVMLDLNIMPEDLLHLYTELQKDIDPSLQALADISELEIDETNWGYWLRRVAAAYVINSELGKRGPFRVDMGTSVSTENCLFGVHKVDYDNVFQGSGHIIKGIKGLMRYIDEIGAYDGTPEQRAEEYELLEKGKRTLDKMAANHFLGLIKGIIRVYHPAMTPATSYPERDYLEQMTQDGLEPGAIAIYREFYRKCPINVIVPTNYGGASEFCILYDHNTGEVVQGGALNDLSPDPQQSVVKLYYQEGMFILAPDDNPKHPWMGEGTFVQRGAGNAPFYELPGDDIFDRSLASLSYYLESRNLPNP
jgi:hypothetical protein